MINKMILGLLAKKDLTVYDIKIAMDKSISNFYSNSLGSINPAIKKLEQQELIDCKESVEKSRLKKTYSITPLGMKDYQNWLAQPIKQGRIKDDVLVRIFFLGDSNKIEQQRLINDYSEELRKSKSNLEVRKEEVEKMDLSLENKEKIKFQLLTLQFGIDYMVFKQKWFADLSNNL